MSGPGLLSSVLLRGCGELAVPLALRCAAAGHGVTLMAEDVHEAQRLAYSVGRHAVTSGVITVRHEAEGAPTAVFAFAPPKSMPADALHKLCMSETGQIPTFSNASAAVAVYLHNTVAELGWGQVSEDVTAAISDFLAGIGFEVIAASNGASRFAGVALSERFNALADHVLLIGAVPWEVDEALENIGFVQGFFAAQDSAGLRSAGVDAPLLVRDRMVAEGRLGRAVGVGWYRYPGGGGAVIDPLIEDMIVEEARFAGIHQMPQTAQDVQERLMLGLACAGAMMVANGDIAQEEKFETLCAQVLGAPDVMAFARGIGRRLVAEKVGIFTKDNPDLWNGHALLALLASDASTLGMKDHGADPS